MKVYVVVGNDYPEAVFSNEEAAETFCEEKRKTDEPSKNYLPKIYWRVYEFELQP